MAHLGFNAAAIEPDQGPARGILPKGRYMVICEKSEVKPTKRGTGHLLALTFLVTEGEYKKRKIFDNINIQNENPIAQRIGQQHLAAFCHALGIKQLDNSYQLHGIPVEVEVGIQPAKDGWEEKNIIRGFFECRAQEQSGIDLSAPSRPVSPAAAAATQQAAQVLKQHNMTPFGAIPNSSYSKPAAPALPSTLGPMDDDIPF